MAEDFDLFKELGLAKNEGKAYETLIKFGKSSAGEVSSRSGVPYSRIYDVLDSLLHRGLVEIIPEKTKKFVPTGPEPLLKIIEEKQKILEKARDKAKELKQIYDVKVKNPVIMGQGRKAFYKVVDELKKVEKYDYEIKWTSEINPKWTQNTKKKLKKGVDLKTLTRYDKKTEKNVKKWIKINKNIKKLNNEGVALSIIDDSEVMISLIKNNVTLLIRDEPFTKVMKKLFLETYNNAEKIK